MKKALGASINRMMEENLFLKTFVDKKSVFYIILEFYLQFFFYFRRILNKEEGDLKPLRTTLQKISRSRQPKQEYSPHGNPFWCSDDFG